MSLLLHKYDETMMDTATLWSKHGTCDRLHVGCVISLDERILVQGYNGAPKGLPHCDHSCDCRPNSENIHLPLCGYGPENCKAVHAEQNAIAWAARRGVSVEGATMYCTHQPCLTCARLIVTAGITRVVYQHHYRLQEGLQLLRTAKISVHHLEFEMDYNTYPQLRTT